MRGIFSIISLAFYASPAFSAVARSLLDVVPVSGQKKPNSYILNLKDGVSHDLFRSTIGSGSKITHSDWDPNFFNGFAGTFTPDDLDTLRNSKDVEYIYEDGIMTVSAVVTQNDAPWGLSRISSRDPLPEGSDPKATTYEYRYDDKGGEGVDVYVVRRAEIGATFTGDNDEDENGHGTHVAGTIGSNTYGVAKKARLIAVKVFGADGSGSDSDVLSGMNWVHTQAEKSGRPSIASMSFGDDAFQPVDDAVEALINSGVHCVVAAGNNDTDAIGDSPAHVPAAITVGATNITDARAWFSNFGASIDVFAPGTSVLSTTNDGKAGLKTGTSMATPHVSGLVAYFISKNGNSSPSNMSDYIKEIAHEFAVWNTTDPNTTTKLVYNLEGC